MAALNFLPKDLGLDSAGPIRTKKGGVEVRVLNAYAHATSAY